VIVALLAVIALATCATAYFVYRLATNVHEALEEAEDPMPTREPVTVVVNLNGADDEDEVTAFVHGGDVDERPS
jgi:hypothetical protein